MADRQNTFPEQVGINKDEVTKLCLKSENGPAVGASGDTELFAALFEEIRNADDIDNSNILSKLETQFLPMVAERARSILGNRSNPLDSIWLLVASFQNGRIIVNKLHGLLRDTLEPEKCECIGSGKNAVGSLLVFETADITEEQAMLWGQEIIRQVSLRNFEVGPPEYHGVDAITIHRGGRFLYTRIPPKVDRIATPPWHYQMSRVSYDVTTGTPFLDVPSLGISLPLSGLFTRKPIEEYSKRFIIQQIVRPRLKRIFSDIKAYQNAEWNPLHWRWEGGLKRAGAHYRWFIVIR